jgi:inhibitor of KinA
MMPVVSTLSFQPMGDAAVLMRFPQSVQGISDPAIRMSRQLDGVDCPGVIEWSIGYHCLAVYFDPLVVDLAAVTAWLEVAYGEICAASSKKGEPDAAVVEIPVCYGGVHGPDLTEVAVHTGLAAQEVIHRHQQPLYRVVMIGFAPGFPYLSGMDQTLATPRKATPRLKIAAGAVGIAGKQTGVYPFSTPGGWQIIGRTPLPLFDVNASPPTSLRPGDYVRFSAISEEEYDVLRQQHNR